MNAVHPKKLLLTKWTATVPVGRDKHFLVALVVLPEPPGAPVERVEIEAVHAKRRQCIAWRELRDDSRWRQGWV